LQIDYLPAILLAALVNAENGYDLTITSLSRYLKTDHIELLKVFDELEVLEDKGLIEIWRGRHHGYNDGQIRFNLPFETIEALRKGTWENFHQNKNLSIETLFKQLELLFADRVQDRLSFDKTEHRMRKLLDNNKHLGFVKKIQDLALPDSDTLVLLRFFHYVVNNDEPDMPLHHLEGLYEQPSSFTFLKRELRSGKYILLRRGLIENTCEDGFGDSGSYRLTNDVREDFLSELDLALTDVPVKGLKSSASISAKDLFYPSKAQRAVDELT
jgi:hypothetical protein